MREFLFYFILFYFVCLWGSMGCKVEEEAKDGKRQIGVWHGAQSGRWPKSRWCDNCSGLVRD